MTNYCGIGIPSTPGPEAGTMCTFTLSTATVIIGAQTENNTDLAHYRVELITDRSVWSTINVLPSSSDQLNADSTTLNINFTGIDMLAVAVLQARVTAVDQCGQQCEIPLVVNCTGQHNCNNTYNYHNCMMIGYVIIKLLLCPSAQHYNNNNNNINIISIHICGPELSQ